MEIVKKMNVPAQVLFSQITDSVLYDIKQQTGKKLTEKQLNGFKYVKSFSKNQSSTIKIEQYSKNRSYHYRTTSNLNDFLVQYDLIPISDTACELRYTEKMESYGYMQKLNDAVVGIILSFFKKRRFNDMLKQMEQSYLQSSN